jgi:NAD(P)-dependent dehydrogenase (short-subunit alcohol dehydrogenase family)
MMSITDKVVLITGSTDGVGGCVATQLAAGGAHVLLHGRNIERAERLIDEIQHAGGRATFYPADLSTLASVRSLAAGVTHAHQRLDILVNNAGVGVGQRGSGRQTTPDGYEWRFAVNYLAGFLLTRMLLPILCAGSPSRIVNVASIGQHPIDFDDVMLTRGYSGTRAYCQSKLAQIMFTFDLAQELGGTGVTVNCLHPATYMDTTMVRNDGIAPTSTVEQGAEAIVHLAASSEMSGRSGLYFDGLRVAKAHPLAYDLLSRARLRRLSFELTGLATST